MQVTQHSLPGSPGCPLPRPVSPACDPHLAAAVHMWRTETPPGRPDCGNGCHMMELDKLDGDRVHLPDCPGCCLPAGNCRVSASYQLLNAVICILAQAANFHQIPEKSPVLSRAPAVWPRQASIISGSYTIVDCNSSKANKSRGKSDLLMK